MDSAPPERDAALVAARQHFDGGDFFNDLARRVAIPTSSREPEHRPDLAAYLNAEIGPTLAALGYRWRCLDNPLIDGVPFLIAERHEDDALPTILTYGHGDTVPGMEGQWSAGRDPWTLSRQGERWYGRGSADNKAQHSINLAAIGRTLETRGRLGFNSRILIETGEEVGSPGLREICQAETEHLRADLLLASDGPRFVRDHAMIVLGTRGVINIEFEVNLRAGAHHSGNWGGLLANAGVVLAHALASVVGPRGEILVPALKPAPLPESVRAALASCRFESCEDDPDIDADWADAQASAVEKLIAFNTFEILAFETGDPAKPANAIPPTARATGHLRFTVDSDPETFVPALRRHLDEHGFAAVTVRQAEMPIMRATRLDPAHPAARWAAASVARTCGHSPMVAPNAGGSLPNDVFAELLGMPTLWVPHSYGGCSQHAPDEHVLEPLLRQGLEIMTGLFWDLGESALAGEAPWLDAGRDPVRNPG